MQVKNDTINYFVEQLEQNPIIRQFTEPPAPVIKLMDRRSGAIKRFLEYEDEHCKTIRQFI